MIEDPARFMGMTTTVTLEPDPIPLEVKVVLFGDRMLYYALVAADPDTARHFKVLADFDDDVDRSPASETMIALALHTTRTRCQLLEVAADVCAAASVAQATGRHALRDRFLDSAAELLVATPDVLSASCRPG